MKEIGGYLELDSLTGGSGEYYKDLIALNTARNALVYLVRAKKIKKIHIPYLLCDSVSLVCEREGIDYAYYHTDRHFLPIFDRLPDTDEYLYVVNLYGQLGNGRIAALRAKYGHIIADNIHAFFQEPVPGVDTLYSCRKFFGVPDGAYLSSVRLPDELPTDCSDARMSHLTGRLRDGASAHYEEFKANDALFETLPLMKMSALTHELLRRLDYERIRALRQRNYSHLHERLGAMNPLPLRTPEGPYAYPFYCENGMEVKKRLAEKKIYVATLWPNVLRMDNCAEKTYAENILPLPCDQRYGTEEMDLVCDALQALL